MSGRSNRSWIMSVKGFWHPQIYSSVRGERDPLHEKTVRVESVARDYIVDPGLGDLR
jgi:hypothetical protein